MTTQIKDVFMISERKNEESKSWTHIGVAFVNRDNSLNVVLDAVPVNGHLHIRDRVAKQMSAKPMEPKKQNERRYNDARSINQVDHLRAK